ncbi:MAG: GtrA family protein [Opitutales bacterium]|nr:GtrA family protein [Opitutales bacterium]
MFSEHFIKSGLRFFIAGLFLTLCDFFLFKLFGYWGVSPSLARLESFAVSFLISFVLHERWTFRSGQSWTKSLLPYLQSRIGSFLLAQVVFMLTHDGLGLSDNLSFAIQVPIQPAVNFFAGYFYVFKERRPEISSPEKRWCFEVIFAPILLFIILAIPFHNKLMQHPIWVVPYTSGAANWSVGQPWKVAIGDDIIYKQKTIEERWSDVATPAVPPVRLVEFSAHDEGWMWVLWFTRKIFPFLSDLKGAVALAIIIHLGLSCVILNHLDSGISRYIFTVIFICNPLIIFYLTLPYYYFWQAFPSLLAVIVWLYREKIRVWQTPLIALFLALCVAIRPNTIFISFAILLLVIYFRRHWMNYVSLVLFTVCFCFIPKTNKIPWHTVYAGLGAYPNNSSLYLSDESPYASFRKQTGISLNTAFGENYYNLKIREEYNQHLKNESLEYIKNHPVQSLKNVILNLSIGIFSPYKPGLAPWIYYLQAVLGLIFLTALIWLRQWPVLIGLGLSLGCIALIYPPIAAYIIGSLVFTALGLTQIISHIVTRFKKV